MYLLIMYLIRHLKKVHISEVHNGEQEDYPAHRYRDQER